MGEGDGDGNEGVFMFRDDNVIVKSDDLNEMDGDGNGNGMK